MAIAPANVGHFHALAGRWRAKWLPLDSVATRLAKCRPIGKPCNDNRTGGSRDNCASHAGRARTPEGGLCRGHARAAIGKERTAESRHRPAGRSCRGIRHGRQRRFRPSQPRADPADRHHALNLRAEIRACQPAALGEGERRRALFPLGLLGAQARVDFVPKGVVGIMAPWNFPVGMVMAPLAGVFAAGNRAMVKPSEFTPRVSDLLAQLVPSGSPKRSWQS